MIMAARKAMVPPMMMGAGSRSGLRLRRRSNGPSDRGISRRRRPGGRGSRRRSGGGSRGGILDIGWGLFPPVRPDGEAGSQVRRIVSQGFVGATSSVCGGIAQGPMRVRHPAAPVRDSSTSATASETSARVAFTRQADGRIIHLQKKGNGKAEGAAPSRFFTAVPYGPSGPYGPRGPQGEIFQCQASRFH